MLVLVRKVILEAYSNSPKLYLCIKPIVYSQLGMLPYQSSPNYDVVYLANMISDNGLINETKIVTKRLEYFYLILYVSGSNDF